MEIRRGPGHRHIEEPPLLGQGLVGLGVDDGYETLLQPDHVDRAPLEPLGPVKGGQLDGISGAPPAGRRTERLLLTARSAADRALPVGLDRRLATGCEPVGYAGPASA